MQHCAYQVLLVPYIERLLLLLGGLDGLEFSITTLLMGIGAGLGVQEVVPPAEAGRVVADELFVVHVVVVGTSPHREDVTQTPREVIATVGVNGLGEAKDDPGVHGNKVQISSDTEHQDRRSDNAQAEKHDLDRRSILSS